MKSIKRLVVVVPPSTATLRRIVFQSRPSVRTRNVLESQERTLLSLSVIRPYSGSVAAAAVSQADHRRHRRVWSVMPRLTTTLPAYLRQFTRSYMSKPLIEDIETESMRERFRYIAAIPVGEFSVGLWLQADETIKWWATQRTKESVQVSFDLLHRLVQEIKSAPLSEERQGIITRFDAQSVIQEMVKNWYSVFREQIETHPDIARPLPLTPKVFLQRLDQFSADVEWSEAFRVPVSALGFAHNAQLARPEPYSESAPFCDYLIDRLLERNAELDPYIVNTTLDLWAKSDRADKVQRAEELFTKASDHRIELDLISYNTLLLVYAQAGLGEKAEKLLQALLSDHFHGNTFHENVSAPDIISFHTVAQAHANSGMGIEAAERVRHMIQRMMSPFDDYGRVGVELTTGIYNLAVLAYSQANVPEAGDEAYSLLQDMKASNHAQPDTVTYGTVIDAYNKSGQPQRAEQVFEEQLTAFQETRNENLRPSQTTMTLLVKAYANAPAAAGTVRGELELLERMFQMVSDGVLLETPHAWTYNTIIESMIKKNKTEITASRIERIFWMMSDRAKIGDTNARPNSWTYSQMIILYMDLNNWKKAEEYMYAATWQSLVALDLRTTGRFIHGLVKRGNAQKADEWLHKMLDYYEEFGRKDAMKPSTSLLGAVLGAWKRRKRDDKSGATSWYKMRNLVTRYEKLVREGISTELPDCRVYASLIEMISTKEVGPGKLSTTMDLVQRLRLAEKRMQGQKGAALTPAYRRALQIFVRGGRLDTATEILNQLIDDYLTDPGSCALDCYCVETVLNGWADHPEGTAAWLAGMEVLRALGYQDGKHDRQTSAIVRRESYSIMVGIATKLSLEKEVAKLREALKDRRSLEESEKAGRNAKNQDRKMISEVGH